MSGGKLPDRTAAPVGTGVSGGKLPDIAEALCKRVASGDLDGARSLAVMLGQRMGGPRADRVRAAFDAAGGKPARATPVARPLNSQQWEAVREPRSPWVPADVADEIASWLAEAKCGDELASAGERVMPLLLCGETRCGKTSSLCAVAVKLGLTVYRLSLGSVAGQYMGEQSRLIRAALTEAKKGPAALWLVDEIDGISMKRNGGQAAADERANAIGVLLAELESLPPGLMFCATTNTIDLMDAAVVARFRAVQFPTWAKLDEDGRKAFAVSHGLRAGDQGAGSYADVVRLARAVRVRKIIDKAAAGERQLSLAGAS